MKQKTISLSIMMIGLGFASGAMASGYHFGTQSAAAQGTANANGAEAADATTIFANPAGLSYVKGTTVSGVLDVVVPDVSFSNKGSSISSPQLGAIGAAKAISGGDGGKFAETTLVPHFFMSSQVNDRLTVGLGAFVPFGSKTQYDDNWAGRYNIVKTELKTFAFNPSFAFKVTPGFTLGGGLTAQYIQGDLSRKVNYGAVLAGTLLKVAGTTDPTVLATARSLYANSTYDGDVEIKGDDWGYGFNLGAMFDIDDSTRFGLAYRSRISHNLNGTGDWSTPGSVSNFTYGGIAIGKLAAGVITAPFNPATSTLGQVSSNASLSVDTPESLSVNVFKQLNDRIALMGDITRTRHSRLQVLNVAFDSSTPNSITPENWSDTTKFSIGGNYKLNDAWLLRAGIAYDQSPVDDSNRTPSIPDGNRTWFSVGANWKLAKDSSLDIAYSYVKVDVGSINNTDNNSGKWPANPNCNCSNSTVSGSYDVRASILGLQFNHVF